MPMSVHAHVHILEDTVKLVAGVFLATSRLISFFWILLLYVHTALSPLRIQTKETSSLSHSDELETCRE